MCGIAGMLRWRGPPPERERLLEMCAVMRHRGPDDDGCHLDGPVAIGMRRLAIIDLATGRQPVFNEDGHVAVVFNGEIYNFRELRRQLEARGHVFATRSDTEVIVHLWEEHGPAFASRLNGMFAIALYDRRRGRLALARDPLGIKPLYVAEDPGGLVFGSEIKVVLASGRVERRLDLDALGQFLAWEYVPGTATLLRDVRRLAPGAVMVVDVHSGRRTLHTSWDPLTATQAAIHDRSEADWIESTDAVIGAAVRRQMVSDVPLGAFLSGGVDSSIVAAHMGARAATFSIGFDDPTYDETPWSRRVAAHLGVSHTVEVIRPDVRALFDKLMEHLDDPIGDFSIFPTYLVSELARRHVKVALSGDGGDELFGGYDTYVAQERMRYWRRIPGFLRVGVMAPIAARLPPAAAKKGLVNKVKRFVEGAMLDEALGHARWRVFATEPVRQRLFSVEAYRQVRTPVDAHVVDLAARAARLDERDRALYVDVQSYLVDNCLAKVDRMSMACSLEVRVPLLDREVVEHAFSMPAELKFRDGATKRVLKRVAERHVPPECVHRTKQGFSIPIKHWLRTEFRDLVERYLAPQRLGAAGIFDAPAVERLLREHDANRANHSHLLWSLLVFEHWRERWSVAT